MRIIAHRGQWQNIDEKNGMVAFRRSFENGYGIETDLRDLAGNIVVSHDMAMPGAVTLLDLLDLYGRCGNGSTLALNIKADGIGEIVVRTLEKHKIEDYFFFDMSVPETLRYLKNGFRYFTRMSEYEPTPALYEKAEGVWLDCFVSDWIDEGTISSHLSHGKKVCIVSPELHGRPHRPFWERLSKMSACKEDGVMICTDFPDEARRWFIDV